MNLLQNFHLAVIEYLYRGRRAVPLQIFTTRHSNRILTIHRVSEKKTPTHIIGYKLRNSCRIVIIFGTKIPHII